MVDHGRPGAHRAVHARADAVTDRAGTDAAGPALGRSRPTCSISRAGANALGDHCVGGEVAERVPVGHGLPEVEAEPDPRVHRLGVECRGRRVVPVGTALHGRGHVDLDRLGAEQVGRTPPTRSRSRRRGRSCSRGTAAWSRAAIHVGIRLSSRGSRRAGRPGWRSPGASRRSSHFAYQQEMLRVDHRRAQQRERTSGLADVAARAARSRSRIDGVVLRHRVRQASQNRAVAALVIRSGSIRSARPSPSPRRSPTA